MQSALSVTSTAFYRKHAVVFRLLSPLLGLQYDGCGHQGNTHKVDEQCHSDHKLQRQSHKQRALDLQVANRM
jgi:hypothetical protein